MGYEKDEEYNRLAHELVDILLKIYEGNSIWSTEDLMPKEDLEKWNRYHELREQVEG